MKTQVPESLKADLPPTTWSKVLTATPVAMTVIATMLAGLASSEMTAAGYNRSLAAQQQSKAGDQWSYYQAKRLRGAIQRSSLDLLETGDEIPALNPGLIQPLVPATNPAAAGVTAALLRGETPPAPAGRALDPRIQAVIKSIEGVATDADINTAVAGIDSQSLEDSVLEARARAHAFDERVRPITQALDEIEQHARTGEKTLRRSLTAARMRYNARRYDEEARLNQLVANLVELQVHKSNQISERHRRRSQRFFVGMLTAQAAVIVSTFSLAARKHSLLWSFAAAAGLAATGFAVWVYFYV